MKKINRHIKAGAIAGLVIPVYWVVNLLVMAPEWRTPFVLIIVLIGGLLAGSAVGALIAGIEKLTSKRLWLILTILPAWIAGLFIAAILLSAQ